MKVPLTFLLGAVMLLSSSLLPAQLQAPEDVMTLEEFRKAARETHEGPWVIDFWASWCGPCIRSMPELKLLHKKYAPKGVKFISLSWDRDEAAWKAAVDRLDMNWTHVFLGANRNTPFIDKYFRHNGIPALFLIRPDGKIRKSDTWKLEKQLDKLL